MRTLAVQVQDGFIKNFMEYVESHPQDIAIAKDKNLDIDPYFYERQERLHKIRDDVHSGKMKLLSQDESDKQIELFFKNIENS